MSKGPDLVILGSGGHGQVLLDTIRQQKPDWSLAFLDPDSWLHGKDILDAPVLGDDGLMKELIKQNNKLYFVVGIGSIEPTPHRQRLFELALSLGLRPFSVRHPGATVSPLAQLDEGAQIMAGAIVNTNARVQANAIVNSRALIEHDCVIATHAHVASGAVLSGGVKVGSGAMIGAGSVVRQYLEVGSDAMVGAGAVVVKNVPDGATVVGVPARVVHRKKA